MSDTELCRECGELLRPYAPYKTCADCRNQNTIDSLRAAVAELEAENQRLKAELKFMAVERDYLLENDDKKLTGRIASLEKENARLRERVKELEAKCERLYESAMRGIGYVGAANYAEREAEAYRWVEAALDNGDAAGE